MESEKFLKVINLPNSEGQLHIHTDGSGNSITGAKLMDNSREYQVKLSNYDAAMADLNAQSLNLDTKLIREK